MSRLSDARRRYIKNPTRSTLRLYLIAKAKTGRWDPRYCRYYGVSSNVNAGTRGFIIRAYSYGLVPTSTTGGRHAPGSHHGYGRAADAGLIERHIGTKYGRDKMAAFQRQEYKRFREGGRKSMLELIGPVNNKMVLRGKAAILPEGNALENQHDDHVHGAFRD